MTNYPLLFWGSLTLPTSFDSSENQETLPLSSFFYLTTFIDILFKKCVNLLLHCKCFHWQKLQFFTCSNLQRFHVSLLHCLDLDLNGFLTRRNFWWIPGMLGNYTIPKWKEFLKPREPILRKSYLSTFIHINKHMDGARGTLWKKS